ncbi:DivIVA domain-containing protein [Nesterenkonia lutea]|uniref:DivIVA domain-containing protein n=1 Tax=Nesterenkonia lutea TaxID=272919 RepID=A0ABR9JFP5_9MICC|nr:DivIVA domain-containing protein [Nesterenkonia lutea]MBE1524593.1 DivIVA domain-containing protein [Nesterenkonia lutea]
MLWLYLLALGLLAAVTAALLGRWEGAAVPEEENPAAGDSDVADLLQRRAQASITAEDLQEVRLDSAVRGYRMDQVDRLLDALAAQLRDAEAALRRREDPSSDRFVQAYGPDIGRPEVSGAAPDQGGSPAPEEASDSRFKRAE